MPSTGKVSRWSRFRSHQQHAHLSDAKSSHFPTEIIQIILDFFDVNLKKEHLRLYSDAPASVMIQQSLASLSLVARVWREPAQRALFKELSPTSYRATRSLLKIVSLDSQLASYVRTISSPSCEKRSMYECNEIVVLFQQLWLICPNVIAIAIPLHPRYFNSATNIWDRGSTLTHLVINPKNLTWERERVVTGPQIELVSLTRLTLYELRNSHEVRYLSRLVVPKLKQLDLVDCSLGPQALKSIWNTSTLERLSLKFTFFEYMIFGDASIVPLPTEVPRLTILADHWFLYNNHHEVFDNIIALHIDSRISMRMFFATKYYPQLEVLDYTFRCTNYTDDLFTTIEHLARFIKEKNLRAPRLVTFNLTIRWNGYEIVKPPIKMPTSQLLLISAYCLYQRCLTYKVSFQTHIASFANTSTGIFEIMPDFPSRSQPWSHNHRSIKRLMHNASRYQLPLWRGRRLPPLASLWS